MKIKLVKEAEGLLCRSLEINYGRNSTITPIRALKIKGGERKLAYELRNGVIEVYIQLTSSRLKELRTDINRQVDFENRISRVVEKARRHNLVVILSSIEYRPNEELRNPYDLGQFVSELTCHPKADVVCVPLFYKVNEKVVDSIVKGFLDSALSTHCKVALTIPKVSRDTKARLLRMYQKYINESECIMTNFLCADYDGSNPITKYSEHNFVLNVAERLEDAFEEPVVVYGANVKYSKTARKYEEVSARDLVSSYVGVDIIAPNHRRIPMTREIAELIRDKIKPEDRKILNVLKYKYIALSKALGKKSLREEHSKLILIQKHMSNEKLVYSLVEQYNADKLLRELIHIRLLLIKDEDLRSYLLSKEGVREDEVLMERLERYMRRASNIKKSKRITEFM